MIPLVAEAVVLNNFRYAQQAGYQHGNCGGCLKGTHSAVLDEIELWMYDFGGPPVYWLNGLAGTGKTCQSHSTLWLPTCCERLLALSNPCWTLPVGCSLVHRGRIESTINLYPTKGKVMAMSAATTSLEWPDRQLWSIRFSKMW